MLYQVKNTDQDQLLKLENNALVVAVTNSGETRAIVVETVRSRDLANFVAQTQAEFDEDFLNFKVIGPTFLINSISRILEPFTQSEIKRVVRSSAFEILYNQKSGKLRVSINKEEGLRGNRNVKVLIVDDSKTIRGLLRKILDQADGIEVVGEASVPSEVEALIEEHKPDVLTLDIHMPEMTGVDLLRILEPKYGIPSIMVTSISIEEGPLVLEALELGAFDYIQKPDISELPVVAPILVEKVKEAALSARGKKSRNKISTSLIRDLNPESMVVIGSSTGGTNAIKDIFRKLPAEIPPILVIQHIPPVFSKAFADRLNLVCKFEVKEAINGEVVKKNTAYIAPGDKQMKLVNKGGIYHIEINDDAPINRFRPSVDYFFGSVVQACKRKHVVSVMLTGMGRDGAKNMLALKNAGAYTIAQSEDSCVVYGMPRAVVENGAAKHIVHKDDIAAKIAELSWRDHTDREAS